MRTARFISLITLLLAFSAAPPAAAEGEKTGGFRCPADNPAFWDEVEEAGWVGYGETWDLHTCEEDVLFSEVYGEGATGKWRAMRPRLVLRPPAIARDVQFYTWALPVTAFGSLGMMFVIAFLIAVVRRRRAPTIAVVACPSCQVDIPIALDDPTEHGVFCPACGQGSVVVVPGEDGMGTAEAVRL